MVVGVMDIKDDKNEGKLLAMFIAMQMQQYNVGRITQWSSSRASLDATGCHHQALYPPGNHQSHQFQIKQ